MGLGGNILAEAGTNIELKAKTNEISIELLMDYYSSLKHEKCRFNGLLYNYYNPSPPGLHPNTVIDGYKHNGGNWNSFVLFRKPIRIKRKNSQTNLSQLHWDSTTHSRYYSYKDHALENWYALEAWINIPNPSNFDLLEIEFEPIKTNDNEFKTTKIDIPYEPYCLIKVIDNVCFHLLALSTNDSSLSSNQGATFEQQIGNLQELIRDRYGGTVDFNSSSSAVIETSIYDSYNRNLYQLWNTELTNENAKKSRNFVLFMEFFVGLAAALLLPELIVAGGIAFASTKILSKLFASTAAKATLEHIVKKVATETLKEVEFDKSGIELIEFILKKNRALMAIYSDSFYVFLSGVKKAKPTLFVEILLSGTSYDMNKSDLSMNFVNNTGPNNSDYMDRLILSYATHFFEKKYSHLRGSLSLLWNFDITGYVSASPVFLDELLDSFLLNKNFIFTDENGDEFLMKEYLRRKSKDFYYRDWSTGYIIGSDFDQLMDNYSAFPNNEPDLALIKKVTQIDLGLIEPYKINKYTFFKGLKYKR